jgi:hypothetical protein
MKKALTSVLLFLIVCFTSALFAQEKKEQIGKLLTEYFKLERENIHVHFDKHVFLTTESIWFKGYVFHRKKNLPFFTTVNVYASLINSEGKIISNQLIYSNIGSFSGSFKLDDSLPSGKYFVQYYTNWMNNFSEDESAVYEVVVVNEKSKAGAFRQADPAKLNIEMHPEGGTLLQGCTNIIGIQVSDCNNEPVAVSEVNIIDNKGTVVKKVQINKLGYGKFDISVPSLQGYKATVTHSGTTHEQAFPECKFNGIALEINNYAMPGKTIAKVRTSTSGLAALAGKPLYMVVHQDDKAAIFEFSFADNKAEQALVLPNEELSDGVNTIRIIDNNLNQLAERLIFNYPKDVLATNVAPTAKTGENITFSGKVNYPNMNLSVSVLPATTLSTGHNNDLYSAFLISPYIKPEKTSGRYYLEKLSKGKHYELDLFLLNQASKYSWFNVQKNLPNSNYPFDMGLTVKGKLPANAAVDNVRLYSLVPPIDVTVSVDDKREFYFHNLIVTDSAHVHFSGYDKKNKAQELIIVPQLINAKRQFNKTYIPLPDCGSITAAAVPDFDELPKFQDAIVLDEIAIEKKRLKYEKSFGNGNLTGHKITEQDENTTRNVIQYITRQGGFNVEQGGMGMDVHIYSRGRSSINAGQSEPIIYIDNIQVLDHNQLKNILMPEVDEIYMSATAIVPSIRNYSGIIKIYLKRDARYKNKNSTRDTMIKNGFTREVPFENVSYASTSGKGFENFGLIDWKPVIMTDEKGEFTFTIPRTSQNNVQIVIEGFSADGKLISEIKTINTN